MPRAHWLKVVGHAKGPMPDAWLEEEGWATVLRRSGFPRRPRIVPGDRLVLYAAVHRRVFAVVEAAGEPQRTDRLRWPWQLEVEPLLAVPVVSDAPPVEAMGVAPRSLSQHSHIRIEERHYRLAVEALASVAL